MMRGLDQWICDVEIEDPDAYPLARDRDGKTIVPTERVILDGCRKVREAGEPKATRELVSKK